MQFRNLHSTILFLQSLFVLCRADNHNHNHGYDHAPWQCSPGSTNLDTLYPELAHSNKRTQNSTIGEGTDGQVYLSSPLIATKRFIPEHTSQLDIHREYWIGHTLSHPHIAHSHSLSSTLNPDDDTRFWDLEMEYLPFALLDLLDHDVWAERPWSFAAISCLFYQVVGAVSHMHMSGLAHRDLKIENIMVSRDGIVKLIDFGSAAPSRDLLTHKRLLSSENWVGTPITMAPEVHGELFYDMEKADVWSLGVVFVRLWLGVYPWEPESVLGGLEENEAFRTFEWEAEDKRSCMHGDDEDRLLCQVPEEARTVIAGMLELNPQKRMSLRRVLRSAWMSRVAGQLLASSTEK